MIVGTGSSESMTEKDLEIMFRFVREFVDDIFVLQSKWKTLLAEKSQDLV